MTTRPRQIIMDIAKIIEKALGNPLQRQQRSLDLISDRVEQITTKLETQEEVMGLLADKIKSLVTVETEEGKVLLDEIAKLKAALVDMPAKLAALMAQVESLLAQLAANESEKAALKAEKDALQADIDEALAAAEAIAEINPTPVSDGLVEEVKANDEVVVPPVVIDAPPVAVETIQEVPVVEAAVDAIAAVE